MCTWCQSVLNFVPYRWWQSLPGALSNRMSSPNSNLSAFCWLHCHPLNWIRSDHRIFLSTWSYSAISRVIDFIIVVSLILLSISTLPASKSNSKQLKCVIYVSLIAVASCLNCIMKYYLLHDVNMHPLHSFNCQKQHNGCIIWNSIKEIILFRLYLNYPTTLMWWNFVVLLCVRHDVFLDDKDSIEQFQHKNCIKEIRSWKVFIQSI